MVRQKIEERDMFSYEDKIRIMKKSGDRCCHCGKKVYPGYGATVDHYIPLSEGGVNRDYNLIMLCEGCNKAKKSKIIDPRDYCGHLKELHLKDLTDYFESYIKSFEFVNRRNILACDEYYMTIIPWAVHSMRNQKKKEAVIKKKCAKWKLTRANEDDYERLCDYYIEYLKKYNCLMDEGAARENIAFWYKFGCIYYLESHDGIEVMTAVTIIDYSEDPHAGSDDKALSMSMFTYGDSEMMKSFTRQIIESLSGFLMREQGIKRLAVRINGLASDKVMYYLLEGKCMQETYCNPNFVQGHYIMDYRPETEDVDEKDEEADAFFSRFTDVEKQMERYLEIHGDACDWMLNEIKPKDRKSGELDTDYSGDGELKIKERETEQDK